MKMGRGGLLSGNEFWPTQVVKAQWEQIWDHWLGKGAFSGPSLKVDDIW